MKWTGKNSKFKVRIEKYWLTFHLISFSHHSCKLKSDFSGFAEIDPVGWNVAGRTQTRSLAILQFLSAFASSTHAPVRVTTRAFVHHTFHRTVVGASRAFYKCWAAILVHKWMVSNVWTQNLSFWYVNL